ncbi:MAG TPA: hypothetical protein VFW60_09130 [Rhodanobacteraceae bacterium]|nr:hypothetical protein [Rhodanobacteraceae bacterium]
MAMTPLALNTAQAVAGGGSSSHKPGPIVRAGRIIPIDLGDHDTVY